MNHGNWKRDKDASEKRGVGRTRSSRWERDWPLGEDDATYCRKMETIQVKHKWKRAKESLWKKNKVILGGAREEAEIKRSTLRQG